MIVVPVSVSTYALSVLISDCMLAICEITSAIVWPNPVIELFTVARDHERSKSAPVLSAFF